MQKNGEKKSQKVWLTPEEDNSCPNHSNQTLSEEEKS